MGIETEVQHTFESVDNVAEIVEKPSEAANLAEDSFSFDPKYIRDGRESSGQNLPDTKLCLIRTCF